MSYVGARLVVWVFPFGDVSVSTPYVGLNNARMFVKCAGRKVTPFIALLARTVDIHTKEMVEPGKLSRDRVADPCMCRGSASALV